MATSAGSPIGSAIGIGVETSCDETAVALVRGGREILANVIYSQIKEHAPFRGVVPEIASRAHLEKINHVYAAALRESGVRPDELSYVAVTNRPGLMGSLMIGAQFARGLALVCGLPIVPVDHVEAHLYAHTLEGGALEYPFLGLLLSGGNSSIFVVRGPEDLELLADTLDDALGEAFDKTATMLGLPYPGGPSIEKAAGAYTGPADEGPLFKPLLRGKRAGDLAFSFSGIKTAVLRARAAGADAGRVCRDFQNTTFELVERTVLGAVERTGIRRVVASGGVLANRTLRGVLERLAARSDFDLAYPQSLRLCTDNGAMIAALGYHLWRAGKAGPLDFPVSSRRTVPADHLPYDPVSV